jgi:hypothetical protein
MPNPVRRHAAADVADGKHDILARAHLKQIEFKQCLYLHPRDTFGGRQFPAGERAETSTDHMSKAVLGRHIVRRPLCQRVMNGPG